MISVEIPLGNAALFHSALTVERGGKTECLEGEWSPPRFVILEFENAERARAWWSSPEYADAKKLRHATANTRMLLVEGLPPGWMP